MSNNNELVPAAEAELVARKAGQGDFAAGMSLGQIAKTIEMSGCFGQGGNAYVAAVKLMAGRDLGLGPIESMRGLHVFDGKIELGSAVMSSKIKGSGRYDYEVTRHDETGCFIDCFEKSIRTDEWKQVPSISFTREEATKAGLLNKKPWQNYFDDMTFSRVMSRFFRRYCPHLAGGAVYAEGEISTDLEPEPRPQPPNGGGGGSQAPREPSGPERPAPAPTQGAETEAAIDKAREVAESSDTPPAAEPESPRGDLAPGVCEECGYGSNLHATACEAGKTAKETSPPATPPPAEGDPAEHPYARFIAQSDELKAAILTNDLGVEDRYRSVFKARGLTNRADVGKGHTKIQREILLELHDALKESALEKAQREANNAEVDANGGENGGPVPNHAQNAQPGAGMDPDIQPGPRSDEAQLPFA